MEDRALSWLALGNRFETFRLTTLGKKNPKVFFSVAWRAKPDSMLSLISLANDLLRIDFESFFLGMAEFNQSFRKKYSVPREPWLVSCPIASSSSVDSFSGGHVRQRQGDSFRSAVEKYNRGSSLPGQDDENIQRVLDFENYREDFFSLLLENASGELLPVTKEHIWKMVEFSFLDDVWLSMEGDGFADAGLFRSWASSCGRISKIYRSAVMDWGDGPGAADRALAFDRMTGILPGPFSDRLKFGKEKGSRFPAGISPIEKKSQITRVQNKFSRNSGRDVAFAISGLIWIECSRLSEISDEFHFCIDGMESVVSSFLCPSPGYKEVQRFEKMLSLGNKALNEIELYENKIGDAESRSFSLSLRNLLAVAEKYLSLSKIPTPSNGYHLMGFPRQRDLHVCLSCRTFSDGETTDMDFKFRILSILQAWSNHCFDGYVYRFPEYYRRILSAALHVGLVPKKCKYCGGLFFPEAPNQQYCKRLTRQSGAKCSDVKQRVDSGEKPTFNSKLQSVKAKARRAKGKSLTAQRYYEDLAGYIQNEAGPLYQASELVDRATYDEWLEKAIGPKSGSLSKLRTREFPYPLIWNGEIEDGTSAVDVSNALEKCPLFADILNDSTWSSAQSCNPDFFPDEPVYQAAWVLRSVIRFNREHPDTVLPIPGLTDCDLFQPCSYKRQEGLQGFVQELDSEGGGPSAQDEGRKLCKRNLER